MSKKEESRGNGSPTPMSMAGVGTHEVVLELVRKYLPSASRVADLAAGEGAFTVVLRDSGYDVEAVDVRDDHWKANGIPLRIADLDSEFADKIAREGGKFDALIAIEIIEHLENPFRFVRECSKLLRPGGVLFLTTPNVEAVSSRLIFLYTGRLKSFGSYETVRPAHITPIFKWKLDMMLEEAGFGVAHEGFTRTVYETGINLKGKIGGAVGKLLAPFLKGEKGGESRIIVARVR